MAYEIGATELGMVALSALGTPVEDPKSKEHYEPFSLYKDLGDGAEQGYGTPLTKWEWGVISQEERDQLETFFTTRSIILFIRTRLPDDSFVTYQARGNWPKKEPVFGGGYFRNFVIEFEYMEIP